MESSSPCVRVDAADVGASAANHSATNVNSNSRRARLLRRHRILAVCLLVLTIVSSAFGQATFNLTNISALQGQSASNGQTAAVAGYWAAGDGGGGTFQWVEPSSATVNNGTVFSGANPAGRWIRELPSAGIDVRMFGAKGDGVTNDRAAIQAAIDEATEKSLPLNFVGRRYLLRGAFPPDHSSELSYILKLGFDSGARKEVTLFGEGATLYTDQETDSPTMLLVHANFSKLEFRDITFERKITGGNSDFPGSFASPYDRPNSMNREGISFFPVAHPTNVTVEVDLIRMSNVRFIDCHRAFTFSNAPDSDYENYKGKINTFRVENCEFLYPYGCNADWVPDGYTAGQATYTSSWIGKTEFIGNRFDGGADVSKTHVKQPKDGFIFHSGGDIVAYGNRVKHFGVEGIYAYTEAFGPLIQAYDPDGPSNPALSAGSAFPLPIPGATIGIGYTGNLPQWIIDDLEDGPVDVYLDANEDLNGAKPFGLGEIIAATTTAPKTLTIRKKLSKWDPSFNGSVWSPSQLTKISGAFGTVHIRKYFEHASAVIANNEVDGTAPIGAGKPYGSQFHLTYDGVATGLSGLSTGITASQLQTALNSSPGISTAGGVSVQAFGDSFIVTFQNPGARPQLAAGRWTVMQAVRNPSGTEVTFTTSSPVPFVVGSEIDVIGMGWTGLTGHHSITQVLNSTQFKIAQSGAAGHIFGNGLSEIGTVGSFASIFTMIEGNASTREVQIVTPGDTAVAYGFGAPGIRVADMKATITGNTVRNCASGIYVSRYPYGFDRSDNAVVQDNTVEMPDPSDSRFVAMLKHIKRLFGITIETDRASVSSNTIRSPLGRNIQALNIIGNNCSIVNNTVAAGTLNRSNIIAGVDVNTALGLNFGQGGVYGWGILVGNSTTGNYFSRNSTSNFGFGLSGDLFQDSAKLTVEDHTSAGDENGVSLLSGLAWKNQSISFLPTTPGWYRILTSNQTSFSGSLQMWHREFLETTETLSYAEIGVAFSPLMSGRRSLTQKAFTYEGNFGRTAVVDAVSLGGHLQGAVFIHVTRAANDPIKITWTSDALGVGLRTPQLGTPAQMVVAMNGGIKEGTITTSKSLSKKDRIFFHGESRWLLSSGQYIVTSTDPVVKVQVHPNLPITNPPAELPISGFIFDCDTQAFDNEVYYPRNADVVEADLSEDRLLILKQNNLPAGNDPIQSGTTAPNIGAQFIGQNYLNTSTGEWFVATGLFETDWKKISLNGRFGAGSAVLPAINFGDNNDVDTGIFQPGVGSLGIAIDGSLVAKFDSGGVEMRWGTETAPGYSFSDDGNTGMYRAGEDQIGIATNGLERMRITNTGVIIEDGLQVNAHVKSLQRCFSVHKNGADQTIPIGTWTVLTWNFEKKDVGACFASNRWTPNIAGVAELSGQAYMALTSAGERLLLGIRKNGNNANFICLVEVTGVTNGGNCSVVIPTIYDDANGTSDYYELCVWRGSGTTISGVGAYTTFNGKLH